MQQSNGAGVRLAIPKEYQLTPPVRAPRKKSPFNDANGDANVHPVPSAASPLEPDP